MKQVIRITPKSGLSLQFPYKKIKINDRFFYLTDSMNHRVKYYHPVRPLRSKIKKISFIEGVSDPLLKPLENFIPYGILVDDTPFERRFEGFFTPQNLTEQDIVLFFDIIAPRYETIIDKKLNYKLIKRIFNKILQYYSNKMGRGLIILDYGVGTGLSYEVYSRLPAETRSKFKFLGTDVSKEMLQICKSRKFSNVRLCRYAQTKYPDNYFDVVFATFVAHYFVDKKPFQEIHRILKPKGVFIFNTKPSSIVLDLCYQNSLLQSEFHNLTCRPWTIESSQKRRVIPVYTAIND